MTINPELPAMIGKTGNMVLATHVNPDGDAIGSLLGLADVLEKMGKRVFRFFEKPVSPLYAFLPDTDRVRTDLQDLRNFLTEAGTDVMSISLDCGDKKRLGEHGDFLASIRPAVLIDHHQGNNGFGDIDWIEPQRSSTGEMIVDLIEALGQPIARNAAACLYTAIVTDTGSFKYESTSAHTFAVARKLVQTGIDSAAIMSKIYDNYSLGRLRLLQMVLSTLEVYHDQRIAVMRVTGDMLAETATTLEDTENFVNHPRSVSSIRVAVFLKENEEGRVSVSMRAKGDCDLAMVASRFGGGGHRNAAGFRAPDATLDQVRDQLLPVLKDQLR